MKRFIALVMVVLAVMPIISLTCFAWENSVKFTNEPILSVNVPDNCIVVGVPAKIVKEI